MGLRDASASKKHNVLPDVLGFRNSMFCKIILDNYFNIKTLKKSHSIRNDPTYAKGEGISHHLVTSHRVGEPDYVGMNSQSSEDAFRLRSWVSFGAKIF